MKNLILLCLCMALLLSCSTAVDNVNDPDYRDNNRLEISSHSLLDSHRKGESISWNASDRTDYVYSVRIAPITTNDEDSIWNALTNNAMLSLKATTENSIAVQNTSRDAYLAVLVVKYPKHTTFQDWIKTLSADELVHYVTTTILIGDGQMRQGTGCVICCDTGSHTCEDGTVMTCSCVNNFCWKKLCPATSKLEPMKEL